MLKCSRVIKGVPSMLKVDFHFDRAPCLIDRGSRGKDPDFCHGGRFSFFSLW